jgi:peptidoglycan/LPS O-acetylase OafA/YrhL
MKNFLNSIFEKRIDQIPALDGLRALAITMVVASHSRNDFIHAGGIEAPQAVFNVIDYLWAGVDLFFVLSGFLIGRILFKEIKRTGSVDVIPFLLKRGFRIWPLYYFVCFISLSKLAFSHQLPALQAILPDFLFLTNYFSEHLAFGTWSLSIEEQFYILTSVILLISSRFLVHSGKRIAVMLGGLLILAPFIRVFTWHHYSMIGMSSFDIEWNILHNFITTHFDGLAMGLLFAALQVFTPEHPTVKKTLMTVLLGSVVALSILTVWNRVYFEYSLAAAGFGAAVWHCLHTPNSIFAKFFSWSGFQVISRLSYGMYLWYRFPLWRIASFVMSHFPTTAPCVQYGIIFILAFSIAAVMAGFTYLLIEKPFLALRDRVYHKKQVKMVYATH